MKRRMRSTTTGEQHSETTIVAVGSMGPSDEVPAPQNERRSPRTARLPDQPAVNTRSSVRRMVSRKPLFDSMKRSGFRISRLREYSASTRLSR